MQRTVCGLTLCVGLFACGSKTAQAPEVDTGVSTTSTSTGMTPGTSTPTGTTETSTPTGTTPGGTTPTGTTPTDTGERSPPGLADLWEGRATLVVDESGPLGWSGFHFPSTWWHDGTCLLYTSPSPRDKRQSRMPSSA